MEVIENKPNADRAPKRNALLGKAVAFGVIAVLSVTFSIAFASIIYTGPLAAYAERGIGLALLGSLLMPIVAALFSSYRGVVCHLQEVPAVLLALSAATIVASVPAGETAFATVAVFVAFTTCVTGAILYLAGVMKLGFLARFIPYSVVGGFLAATGVLLVLGGLSTMIGEEVTLARLGRLLEPGHVTLWLPGICFGLVAAAATRLWSGALVLPLLIIGATLLFFLVLAGLGVSLDTAREMGLLLGPFRNASFLEGLSPGLVTEAHWGAILAQLPTTLTVAVMTVLGLLLNSSGIEIATNRELDLGQELKATGLANLVASLSGGSVGYHLMGETALAHRMGATGLSVAFATSVSSAVVLLFGVSFIGILPAGLMGGVAAYLGFDFIYEWLWAKRRRLPLADRLIILLIVIVAATIGFLQAFSVGLVMATILFVISYAGVEVVRLRSTAAVRRSSVERGAEDLARLETEAGGVLIYELSGYLFFGTANRLLEQIRSELAFEETPRHIVIDFRRVNGLDTSACFALSRIAVLAERQGLDLTLTGLHGRVKQHFLRSAELTPHTRICETLDDALTRIETEILGDGLRQGRAPSILEDLTQKHPGVDLSGFATTLHATPGEVIVTQGSESNDLFQLVEGVLRAEVAGPDGSPIVVARFLPGAIVGEIAYYAEVPRTAAIVAETAATVLRFDLEALPATPEAAVLASTFHRVAARHLARRLTRMTHLFREAGL